MDFDDERFKYFPAVDSARITDSTPKEMARASSSSTSGADLEALFSPELVLSEDGIAHALAQETVEAEVLEGGNLMDGVSRYVDEMYSENVGFDIEEDVKLKRYSDGEAHLDVDIHYEPEADFVSNVDLPGSLTVIGEVREEYKDELEEYNPSGRF